MVTSIAYLNRQSYSADGHQSVHICWRWVRFRCLAFSSRGATFSKCHLLLDGSGKEGKARRRSDKDCRILKDSAPMLKTGTSTGITTPLREDPEAREEEQGWHCLNNLWLLREGQIERGGSVRDGDRENSICMIRKWQRVNITLIYLISPSPATCCEVHGSPW